MIAERIAVFPSRKISVQGKTISYREAGAGPALLLLHGIGSGSASWLFQLEDLSRQYRVVAWDAPGYGASDAFSIASPRPDDYARALSVLLTVLKIRDFVLVAHSLGCLIAGAYARMFPALPAMGLISPAGGYGGDLGRIKDRLEQLEELGPEGLAEKRAAAMLSPNASAESLELARWNYRRIRPEGYRQAAHCLAAGKLADDAPFFRNRVLVLCGTEDTITPQALCRAIAKAFPNSEYRPLPGLGHASHVENPVLLNALVREFACYA